VHSRSSSFSRCSLHCTHSTGTLGTFPCVLASRVAKAEMSAGPKPGGAELLAPERLPLRREVLEPTAGWKEHSEISWASRCLRSS